MSSLSYIFAEACYPHHQPQHPPAVYIPSHLETTSVPVFCTGGDGPHSPIIDYDRSPNYVASSATCSKFFSDSDTRSDPAVDNS